MSSGLDEQIKQLNIRIPEKLRWELKAKCALDGWSMAEAIEELAKAYVAGKVKIVAKASGGK